MRRPREPQKTHFPFRRSVRTGRRCIKIDPPRTTHNLSRTVAHVGRPETKGAKPERVVISFGPGHSLLEQRQVELAWEEARTLSPKPTILVFAAQFDPEAAKDIECEDHRLLTSKEPLRMHTFTAGIMPTHLTTLRLNG